VIVAALVLKRADFTAATFDPLHARAIGLPVRALDYGMLAMIALAVVAALQAVGIILAIALMITPGATAALWTRRMGPMLLFAAVFGVLTAQAGVYAAFWIDAAPAPTIVLLQTLGFVLSLARAQFGARGGVGVS
jgi:manganese/iron transport system permease protein